MASPADKSMGSDPGLKIITGILYNPRASPTAIFHNPPAAWGGQWPAVQIVVVVEQPRRGAAPASARLLPVGGRLPVGGGVVSRAWPEPP